MTNLTSYSASQESIFIRKDAAAQLIGYAPDTLKKLRANGVLREGIHWVRINSRSVRYNKVLLMDWVINRDDAQAHERAIEMFFMSLPSNQKTARRKSKRSSETRCA